MGSRLTIICIISIIFIIVVFPVYADESVTLEQVIDGALQNSTGISQARKDYENKLADSKEAVTIDNPEFKADFVREQGVGGTGEQMELTQLFKFSQLTGARFRFANLLRCTADNEKQYEILKIINGTTILYMRLWLLQEQKRLYVTATRDAEGMSKLVKDSASQGQTSAAASYLFAADAQKLNADAVFIEAQLRQIRTDISKLTGRSFLDVHLKKPVFSKIPSNSEVLVAFAKDHANLRNIIKEQIKAAEQRVSIARQDGVMPQIGPRLVYSHLNNGIGFETDYGVGVQVSIPLWNQNNVERKRADADLDFVKTQQNILAGVSQKEVIRQLQQSGIALADRADSYEDQILPGYRKSYELTREMFQQGQIDALEVWQVREKLRTIQDEALQAMADAFNARSALELELGGKLEEIK
jgi:outer membrane protein TolC